MYNLRVIYVQVVFWMFAIWTSWQTPWEGHLCEWQRIPK